MTDLIDLMRQPPFSMPVNNQLGVVQGDVDETMRLKHPRLAWDLARIELHRHTDGLWMWSVSYSIDGGHGSGYRVGPKWGKFAENRDDALHWAVKELMERVSRHETGAQKIVAWARSLK